MEWRVQLAVKDYVRNWSNQKISTKYKDVMVDIFITDLVCDMTLIGEKGLIEETFYLIWELLFLYDGYFYEPKKFVENGNEKNPNLLVQLPFYKTDSVWYKSSELLGRGNRELTTEVIKEYALFRNTDMSCKKMTKSVVNAFYYLHSESYKGINANHRLSLLLNVGDGFVINTIKDTNNVYENYKKLFKKAVDFQKIQKVFSLIGMSESYKYYLGQERHQFDHYIYCENSISTNIYNMPDETGNYVIWFFIYILDLVIRINFLQKSGVTLEQKNKDYAFDCFVDGLIYEFNLEEPCSTWKYRSMQLKRGDEDNDGM